MSKKLAKLCDTMDDLVARDDLGAFSETFYEADSVAAYHTLSDYERAIVAAFDTFDRYRVQRRYVEKHGGEWSRDYLHHNNINLEKYAYGTQCQQELIRVIYGMDEETVHEDLELWTHYIDHYEGLGVMLLAHGKVD